MKNYPNIMLSYQEFDEPIKNEKQEKKEKKSKKEKEKTEAHANWRGQNVYLALRFFVLRREK